MSEEHNENEPVNIEAADDELLAATTADADSDAEQDVEEQDTAEQGAQTSDSLDALVEQVAKEQTAKQWSSREKILAGVAGVAIVVAIAGFSLFAVNAPGNAAAKFDGGSVSESEVTAYIDQYRNAYGTTDDSSFASLLKNQNMTVASYRQSAIDQLVLQKLIEKRANELGVSVSDDDVEARLQEVREQMGATDDDTWQSTLESYGVTEDSLRSTYRSQLLQDKVCEQDVPEEEPSDDDTLNYISSYLADTTQKHVYRIVFTSDDGKSTKAGKCTKELKKLKKSKKLDAAAFEELVAKYSESDTAADDKGAVGWSGSDSISDTISELIDSMSVGDFSDATTVEEDDNALEIIYVDQDFTFPSSSDIESLDSLSIPDELLSDVKSAVSYSNWQTDCSTYIAKLLADAKVTYYPVPDDASYNVDLSIDYTEATTTTDDSASSESASDDSSSEESSDESASSDDNSSDDGSSSEESSSSEE